MKTVAFACIIFLTSTLSFATAANNQKNYYRTAFSQLTSEVWRYRNNFSPKSLSPVPSSNVNPNRIQRDKPSGLTLNKDGSKLYVILPGTENKPGNQVAVINTTTNQVIKRITVGSRPFRAVLHSNGRFLVVTNEYSNFASVIDTTIDKVVNIIPLDFYAQDIAFSPNGKQAWVAIRYLDQVLVIDLIETNEKLLGTVRIIGGFDDKQFYGNAEISKATKQDLKNRGLTSKEIQVALEQGNNGINNILRSKCSTCHNQYAGGFLSGDDPTQNFLSAVENSIGGAPFNSPLLRAVLPTSMGGFGDQNQTAEFHPGGALFQVQDPDLKTIVNWIKQSFGGPGIPTGNEQSHPKELELYGKYLLVGNTGTMDIAVIDTTTNKLVSGIYIQNVANAMTIKDNLLIVATMGAGFGAPKERDPYGGETWDKNNLAAQFTIMRDPDNGYDAYPIDQQETLGPYDAVDGTWNFKMRDIQNDIIVIDLSKLKFDNQPIDYSLKANKYESHLGWVRYTSDTAEATTGDIKGDIPPELQRVPGAFPESMTFVGNKLYISMAGSFEVIEWQLNPNPSDFSTILTPQQSFKTGLRPTGLVVTKNHLYVANRMSEAITIINLNTKKQHTLIVGNLSTEAVHTDAERGDVIIHSAMFSSDGDISCMHCHYRDTGDGRAWGAAEVVGQNHHGIMTSGGTLGIPQIKNITALEPFYFEGTHTLAEGQGADINEPASSIDFDRPIWAGDYSKLTSPVPIPLRRLMHEELKERVEVNKLGDKWYDLEYRREQFLKTQSKKVFGHEFGLKDFYRFVGAWMGEDNRLLPNPYDKKHPSIERGQMLFNSAQVMCSVCHTAPEFTNKTLELTNNDRRALPQLTTMTRRDASYSLASVFAMENANGNPLGIEHPDDPGRFEDTEGTFTTMTLRGIFDRPPVFLHHARARSIREVLLTPGHPAARQYIFPVLSGDENVRHNRKEIGFNELTMRNKHGALNPVTRIIDSHGGTSHLSPYQINDLLNFIKSIE